MLDAMGYAAATHLVYAGVSVAMTVWVARTLHRHGRPFLVESFHGNQTLADSINTLLVVGFYLVNIGFIALWLKHGEKPGDLTAAIEFVSSKVGIVLLVLGVMHFGNIAVFSAMRARAKLLEAPPPVEPDERLAAGA